jgi:hypothetical protein
MPSHQGWGITIHEVDRPAPLIVAPPNGPATIGSGPFDRTESAGRRPGSRRLLLTDMSRNLIDMSRTLAT